MRRSFPRGGRRGGNQGPLVTEHLQDLDLELELLKRKRVMIEQQQQLLRQSNFGLSSYSDQRFDDFSYMYDERPAPSYSADYGSLLGKRRHNISPWQDEDVPPKRFPTYRGKSPRRAYDHRQAPRHSDFRPEPQPYSRRSNPTRSTPPSKPNKRPGPKPFRNEFKPSKVTKPKDAAGPSPNKLASYPVETRKKLVSEASTANESPNVLSADREPSQQVTGRLELALGHILKELKLAYSTDECYSSCFGTQTINRVIKQGIRERIRSAMLGQLVGNVQDIIDHYRKIYPPAKDTELLNLALNKTISDQAKHDTCVEEDDPEKYFNVNMHRILEATLKEMFVKLQNIYGRVKVPPLFNEGELKPQGRRPQKAKPIPKKSDDNATETDKKDEGEKQDESVNTEKANEDVSTEKTDEKDPNIDEGESTTAVLDTADANEAIPEEDSTAANVEEAMPSAEENTAENPEAKEPTTENAEPATEQTEEPMLDKAVKAANVTNDAVRRRTPRARRSKDSENFIESVIKRKMPYMLQKHIPHIIKILNLNHMYKTATADIYKKTISLVEKAASTPTKESPKEKPVRKEGTANDLVVDNTGELRFTLPPPKYFVKIIARPSLPKRKLMQTFLDQFNPRTIKKHKRVHSLLFVGFVNKEDFDNIIAASGTLIGRVKLEIKVSEWTKDKAKEKDDDTTLDTTTEADQSAVSELNNQIDDLLSSIRQADEDEKTDLVDSIKTEVEVTENESSQKEETEVVPESETEKDVVEESKSQENGTIETTDNGNVDAEVQQTADEEVTEEKQDIAEVVESTDKVEALKSEVKEVPKGTPTRSSARLNATPSTIKTRRASKLAQN